MISAGEGRRGMGIKSEAKMPGADCYPNWLFPAFIAAAAPFFGFFLYEDKPLRAFAAALSVGAILVTVVTLWQYRRSAVLWAVLLTAAVLHGVLVQSLPNADTHFPGIIFTPVVVLDVLFWQFVAVRLINLLAV